ncbi:unannotated protein [freshwater metagenome]|uniref:Unannotated protein n=1 Tax=freshwater metagenome TaxID=449393 RepID=A0A6J7N549_9ZZZZ
MNGGSSSKSCSYSPRRVTMRSRNAAGSWTYASSSSFMSIITSSGSVYSPASTPRRPSSRIAKRTSLMVAQEVAFVISRRGTVRCADANAISKVASPSSLPASKPRMVSAAALRRAASTSCRAAGESASDARRMPFTSLSGCSGSHSHDSEWISHSLGPRNPYSKRKPSNFDANSRSASVDGRVTAASTASGPTSNSAVISADAFAARDRSHSPVDGAADWTSPRPEISSSWSSGRPTDSHSPMSIVGPRVEPRLE